MISSFFWLSSRYPQLSEKALMGGDTKIIGLSFDFVYVADSDANWWEVVFSNTVNWIDTNKKGMTFGLLFAPALMLLFSLIDLSRFKNKFTNTLSGVLIGAPLGVCVNCATPIAKGVFDTSKKIEIALATLFSSPTLNIIILSMLFTLFPLHLALLKIGGSLLFILLVVPIAAKIFESETINLERIQKKSKIRGFEFSPTTDNNFFQSDWASSLKWTLNNFFRGLWFIIKTTVPLMLLAGILGNVLVSFFPQDSVVSWLGINTSFYETLLLMVGISIIGTFLPVPIAFDVILVLILSSLGLADRYSMILLFTLGIFSIYPFSIIYKFISKKVSLFLALTVVLFGIGLGVTAHYIEKNIESNRSKEYQALQRSTKQKPLAWTFDSTQNTAKNFNTKNDLSKQLLFENDSLVIHYIPFNQRDNSTTDTWFKKLEAKTLGLTLPYRFSPVDIVSPYSMGRSIAAEDLNNDFYTDLVITSATKLFLAYNQGNRKFELEEIVLANEALNAKSVDFNNDGWKDLFISIYKNHNLILWNDSGRFSMEKSLQLKFSDNPVLTIAPAFADFDNDGRIDIFLGNWTAGEQMARFSMPSSKNYILLNKEGGFKRVELEGMDGETLSSLISDLNDDGIADLIVANDFAVPDYFYYGVGDGTFNIIEQKDSIIKSNSFYTMSIASADIDNDLSQEIYLDQIDRNISDEWVTEEPEKICGEIIDSTERANCEYLMGLQQDIRRSFRKNNIYKCPEEFYEECLAYNWIQDLLVEFNRKNHQLKPLSQKSPIPSNWTNYNFLPDFYTENHKSFEIIDSFDNNTNNEKAVLFMRNKDLSFTDQAKKFNLKSTGWAWNAQFADIDGDEWQDLYIVNGFMMKVEQESNLFYRNVEGKEFVNQTVNSEMENFLPTGAYSYIDFDFDGDLDIFAASAIGPLQIYENTSSKNNFIAFKLTNEFGGSAIGAKVIIEYGDNHKQLREVKSSGGFKSFNSNYCYFGLGKNKTVERITIVWQNGSKSNLDFKLPANRMYNVLQKNPDQHP
ncbi:MAG: VCBS repeat-containing protein [Flavobacteriales bacterium]|nr:VCBS repeat-containing protein [Flavobacteriales bacterium]